MQILVPFTYMYRIHKEEMEQKFLKRVVDVYERNTINTACFQVFFCCIVASDKEMLKCLR